jgi:hypothetical protein
MLKLSTNTAIAMSRRMPRRLFSRYDNYKPSPIEDTIAEISKDDDKPRKDVHSTYRVIIITK